MPFPSAHPLTPSMYSVLVLHVSQVVNLVCSGAPFFLVSPGVLVLGTALSWGISATVSHAASLCHKSLCCVTYLWTCNLSTLGSTIPFDASSGWLLLQATCLSVPLCSLPPFPCVRRHILATASCNTALCIYFFLPKNSVLLRVQILSDSPSPLKKKKVWPPLALSVHIFDCQVASCSQEDRPSPPSPSSQGTWPFVMESVRNAVPLGRQLVSVFSPGCRVHSSLCLPCILEQCSAFCRNAFYIG